MTVPHYGYLSNLQWLLHNKQRNIFKYSLADAADMVSYVWYCLYLLRFLWVFCLCFFFLINSSRNYQLFFLCIPCKKKCALVPDICYYRGVLQLTSRYSFIHGRDAFCVEEVFLVFFCFSLALSPGMASYGTTTLKLLWKHLNFFE